MYTGSGAGPIGVGTVVDVTGVVDEWDDFGQWADTETEVDITQGGSIEARRRGTVPAPVVLPASTFLSTADMEPCAGVRVQFAGVVVEANSDALGNAVFTDGVRASRAVWSFGALSPGDTYTVTGPVGYSFTSFYLVPQGPDDLEQGGGA